VGNSADSQSAFISVPNRLPSLIAGRFKGRSSIRKADVADGHDIGEKNAPASIDWGLNTVFHSIVDKRANMLISQKESGST
jgi:hypothetical protein